MILLHIDTSILGGNSVSRELTALIVNRFTATEPDARVIYRDLVSEEIPHATAATMPSAHPLAGSAGHDAPGQTGRSASDAMLQEFLDADTVVLGVPMYNFTIPSQLKAWIDRIVVPGTTFRYGANGPEGLMRNKRVIVAIARGGFYVPETAEASAEHAESYLRLVLGFIGVTAPEFILAEGLSRGEHNKANAVSSARAAVEQLAA